MHPNTKPVHVLFYGHPVSGICSRAYGTYGVGQHGARVQLRTPRACCWPVDLMIDLDLMMDRRLKYLHKLLEKAKNSEFRFES